MFREDSTSNQTDGYARMPASRTLMTNRFTLLFVSLLVSVLTVTAQRPENHGLVVTGSVHKVEARCFEGKQFVAVTLSLQTRNDSPEPIILISGMTIFDLKLNFITTKKWTTSLYQCPNPTYGMG